MASIALSIVGTAIAGPIGGQAGAMIGGLIDNKLFPGSKAQPPTITASTYGNAIARVWGPQNRIGVNMIWTSGPRKDTSKNVKQLLTKGVLGAKMGQKPYIADLFFAVAMGPLQPGWLKKIWANGTVVFDATAATSTPAPDAQGVVVWDLSHKSHQMMSSVTVYPGNDLQLPDPIYEASVGVGNAPAYRGTACFMLEAFQITPFGNGVPVINVEVAASESVNLASVCLDIATLCGLDPREVSTSALNAAVAGYAITSQTDGVAALQPLALVYNFDFGEVAGALRFTPRGQPALCAIPNVALAGHVYGDQQPDAFSWPRETDNQLPKVAALTFNDPARDLNQNTQSAKRSTGNANSNISATVQMTLTSNEGRSICDRMLWEAQIGRQTFSAKTDDRLFFTDAGRNFAFETPAGLETVRITKRTRGANGVVELEGKRDVSQIYSSTAPGQAAPTSNPLRISGPVNPPVFIEPPSNFPGVTQPTLLIALSGGDGTTADLDWAGCSVFASTDDADYVQIGSQVGPTCMGKLTAQLDAPTISGGSAPDMSNAMHVSTAESAQDVPSINAQDAEDALTPYYVGGEFLTLEDSVSGGSYAFTCTNLWRGLYGSTAGVHLTGADVVRCDASIFRWVVPKEYIGRTIYFRFPGAGETVAGATTYTHAAVGSGYGTAAGGLPAAPAGVAVNAAPGGNVITWDANTPDDNVNDHTVYRADGTGAAFGSAVAIGSAGNATSYTDTTATPGAPYTYFVVAANVVGAGAASAGADATTSSSTPGQYGAVFSCQDISTKPLSTVIGRFPSGISWNLPATTDTPAGYADGKVDVAPSAQTDFDLLKDGVSVGTIRFALGSTTPTLIKAAASAFIGTDYLDLKTPATLNGMRGAFGVIVVGQKT